MDDFVDEEVLTEVVHICFIHIFSWTVIICKSLTIFFLLLKESLYLYIFLFFFTWVTKFYQALTNNMENFWYMLQGSCLKAMQEVLLSGKSNMKRANRKFVLFTAWDKFQLETFPASCLAPPEASDCRQHTEMKESNRNKILWYIYINMYLWQEVGLKLLYTLDLSPGLHHVWAFQPDISDGVVTSHPDTLYSWQG